MKIKLKPLKDHNPIATLHRSSENHLPMQHLRELVQNSIEAGAKKIRLYEEPQFLEQGIRKLAISDDGPGMSPAEMQGYLTVFNRSSKSTGLDVHGNFGWGARVSTMQGNPHGVVYISYSEAEPRGCVVCYAQSCLVEFAGVEPIEGTTHVYRLDDLEQAAPDGVLGCKLWDCKTRSTVKTTGMIVLLLGEDHEASSCVDLNGTKLTLTKTTQYFNDRYDVLPDGVSLSIAMRGTSFQCYGLSSHLENLMESYEVIEHGGFTIEVYITKTRRELRAEKASKGEVGHNINEAYYFGFEEYAYERGWYALEYKGELYRNEKPSFDVARSWGIHDSTVIPKVKLVVHPPHAVMFKNGNVREPGVMPNPERSALIWRHKRGSEARDNLIPLDKVKEYFSKNHPPKLKALLDRAYDEARNRLSKLDLKSEKDRMRDFWQMAYKPTSRVNPKKEGDAPYSKPEPQSRSKRKPEPEPRPEPNPSPTPQLKNLDPAGEFTGELVKSDGDVKSDVIFLEETHDKYEHYKDLLTSEASNKYYPMFFEHHPNKNAFICWVYREHDIFARMSKYFVKIYAKEAKRIGMNKDQLEREVWSTLQDIYEGHITMMGLGLVNSYNKKEIVKREFNVMTQRPPMLLYLKSLDTIVLDRATKDIGKALKLKSRKSS